MACCGLIATYSYIKLRTFFGLERIFIGDCLLLGNWFFKWQINSNQSYLAFLLLLWGFYAVYKNFCKLKTESSTDYLTQVYNRSYYQKLIFDLDKKKEKLETLGIVMLDLDNFKELNNKYGHKIEDKVLFKVASTFKEKLRPKDVLIRYGGDEFIAFSPEIDKQTLDAIVKRLGRIFIKVKDIMVTTSLGYTLYPEDGKNIYELVNLADKRLYKNKSLKKSSVSYLIERSSQLGLYNKRLLYSGVSHTESI
jgi:diguanylate cyclase (GGDEF)-like protein